MKRFLKINNLGLILINLIPFYGAIFLGWKPITIIMLYVVETILAGIMHVLKMSALYYMNHNNPAALAVKRNNSGVSGLGLIPFFIFHFGFFVFVQMMVFGGFSNTSFFTIVQELFTGNYKFVLATYFITNLTIVISELLWDPEIDKKLPDDIFLEPYPRIIIQQFMVILGGWISIFDAKNMLGYLIVLILLKTFFDLMLVNVPKDVWLRWLKRKEKSQT